MVIGNCPVCGSPMRVGTDMTNADRIRAMSDEELVKWFTSVCTAKSACSCMDCPFDAFMRCGFGDWLKQEVKE